MKCRIILVANIPEAAEMLKYSFEELGIPTVIQDDAALSGNDFDFNITIKALRKGFTEQGLNGHKILFQTEELWNRREKAFYDLSNGYKRVLEMYDENVKIPVGTKNVVYCPVGYTPTYSMGLPEPEERDIDILFWGGMTERRSRVGADLNERFKDKKIVFGSGIYGKEREELIMRSKIVLNIKAHDLWSFGPIHVLPAIANKRFVLAEKANGGYGPFKPGRHFKEYNSFENLFSQIEYWLEREEEREIFTQEALELVKKECYFTPILKEAMRGLI
jgi:hypothetical protein